MRITLQIFSILVLIAMLTFTFMLGWRGMPTEMGLTIASGAIAALFLNLDKLIPAKPQRIEIKSDRDIRESAIQLVESILDTLQTQSPDTDPNAILETKQKAIVHLQQLNLNPEQIQAIRDRFDRLIPDENRE